MKEAGQDQKYMFYVFGREFPVGISKAEINALAEEISVSKRMDKGEVLRLIKRERSKIPFYLRLVGRFYKGGVSKSLC